MCKATHLSLPFPSEWTRFSSGCYQSKIITSTLLFLFIFKEYNTKVLTVLQGTVIYKWPSSYHVLFSLSCSHKLTVYFDWQSFPAITSFWPFHELNEHFSLFPSSSVSWLRVFVCWDDEFQFRGSFASGLFCFLSFFLSFFSQLRAATEEKAKLNSGWLIP